MNIHTHFLFPFTIGMILTRYGIIPWEYALICGLIGMFIDIDHYIEYVIHTKKFSLRKAWNNASKYHRFEERSFIHHWQGFLIITLMLIVLYFFYYKIALILSISYYSHIVLDYVWIKSKNVKFSIGKYYFKETYLELILNIILVIILLIIFLL